LIGGKMTGSGGTIGTYAAWRFVDHWRLDGMFGWSDIFYNGTAGTASGSFTGSRWLGSGGFTGDYRWAGFLLQPSARIYTLWENDTAFTDSLGTQQAARNFSASRVSVGDKVSYPLQASPTLRALSRALHRLPLFLRQRVAGRHSLCRHPERLLGARHGRRDVDVPRRTVAFAQRRAWRHRRRLRPLVGQRTGRLAVLTTAAALRATLTASV